MKVISTAGRSLRRTSGGKAERDMAHDSGGKAATWFKSVSVGPVQLVFTRI